jgi:hypothetical protein
MISTGFLELRCAYAEAVNILKNGNSLALPIPGSLDILAIARRRKVIASQRDIIAWAFEDNYILADAPAETLPTKRIAA